MTDWAAALTYYGLLSLFPALIALVSVARPVRRPADHHPPDHRHRHPDRPELGRRHLLRPDRVDHLEPERRRDPASSSGWRSRCGRPRATSAPSCAPRTSPGRRPRGARSSSCGRCRSLVTLAMVIMLALVALALVLTGPIVEAVGDSIGVGDTALTIWDIAKWPVLLGRRDPDVLGALLRGAEREAARASSGSPRAAPSR